MYHVIAIILVMALMAIMSGVGVLYIKPDSHHRSQVATGAAAGFSGLLQGAKAFRANAGRAPATLAETGEGIGFLPPSFKGLSWSLSSARLCLSGMVSEAAWEGLSEASDGLPSGYAVGTACDGTGSKPAAWPAFVAASAPI
ncbi:MAG: hypothetical protein VR70_10955 [Rhodospirillaceae bacterium BRH_c57]|nr:MAG: hypothetical protein VR70_10955 [Rhodospirillaceae bacterium BRH_c57]